MALFKISKGQSANLPVNINEGYAYVTTDEQKFYVDTSNDKRIQIDGSFYVVGTQTTTTEKWTGVLKNVSSLYDGLTISYWLPQSSASNATLALTLDDGTATEYPVYTRGTTRAGTQYPKYSLITLTFRKESEITAAANGAWFASSYYYSDTFDRLKSNSVITSGDAIAANAFIGESNGAYYQITGSTPHAFNITSPILHIWKAIARNEETNDVYFIVSSITVGYIQTNMRLTPGLPVYLKGSLSGIEFTPVSYPLTQNVPQTEDGYQYLPVGVAITTGKMRFFPQMQAYEYKSGNFQPVGSSNSKYAKCYVGSENAYPYHKFLQLENISGPNYDISGIYLLNRGYVNGGAGTFKVALRLNDANTDPVAEITWISRDSALPVDCIGGVLSGTSSNATFTVYYKAESAYAGANITQIVEGTQRHGQNSTPFVLMDSKDENGESPINCFADGVIDCNIIAFDVGVGANTQSKLEEYIHITTVNGERVLVTDLPLQFTSSEESGTTTYLDTDNWNNYAVERNGSNVIAGSNWNINAATASAVAWGNITGKPSTFTPAEHTHAYLPLVGGTITGDLKVDKEIIVTGEGSTDGASHIRLISGNYGVIIRNDGSNLYLLATESGNQYGTWNSNLPSGHPIRIDMATGYVYASKLYGAVWNDYAEYRQITGEIEPGRVVIENGDDTLSISTKRMQPGANVVSDTFGFAIGETNKCKTPLAVSGRVLAYTDDYRDSFKPGEPVCSGPNGTVSHMTREEIMMYPECIIGYVSSVPNYDTWGTDNVKVNGRIWIKV